MVDVLVVPRQQGERLGLQDRFLGRVAREGFDVFHALEFEDADPSNLLAVHAMENFGTNVAVKGFHLW